ncbi:MAG: hypothetical protein K0S47_3177 [Herbinix sp.]|jgi:hypothetical protein|nr:hypothetical protein [Herbinix sp.]
MSDLISREALLKKIEGKNSYSVNTATTNEIMKSYAYADCICIIEHEPTAYDVDKVAEQLEEEHKTALIMSDKSEFFLGQLSLLNRVIPLLKGAVKDE